MIAPNGKITKTLRKAAEICEKQTMSRVMHAPYTIEQDEDRVVCACSAQARWGAVGDSATRSESAAGGRQLTSR